MRSLSVDLRSGSWRDHNAQRAEAHGHYPQKKTFYDPSKYSDDNVFEKESYINALEGVNPEECVYLDEFGCCLNMNLDYGRSPSGERVYDENPRDSGERVSTAAVLTEKGIEAEFSYTGSMTAELFVFYLERYVLKLLVGGKVLIMDNLPAHCANIVEEFLNKHNILYIYLPPYSPELNPIEEAFSKIKHFVRKQKPRTLQALYEARKKAISLVTEDDAIAYINHSYEFL